MSFAYTIVTSSIRSLTHIICKIDTSELSKVPKCGPLILVSNHINFVEIPILYTHLQPRPVTGFAKAESWNNPAVGYLFNMWGAIPLRRGEADTTAFRSALEALKREKIIAIAPEGTRSGHGKLQQAHPGIVMIAYRSGAPILPLVYYGGERFRDNIKRLKRTDFHIRVGKIFKLSFPDINPDHTLRKMMVEEIMYQLAALLPQEYRGYYSDLSKLTTNYIKYI